MNASTTKWYLLKILPFGLIWFVFSLVYVFLERGLLGNLEYYPATDVSYNFYKNLIITPGITLVTGLLIGFLEVVYFKTLFNRKSFIQKVIFKTLIYLFVIVGFLIFNALISNAVEMRTHIFDEAVLSNVGIFFYSFAFWSVVIFIAFIISITLFYAEVSDNLGPRVLNNFIIGKYHEPIEEERVFMFLDMKSSTTIAEKIGHIRYFELLKDYYNDLSASVIKYGAEIYQYVGDEMVLTWKLEEGNLNNRLLNCFFNMQSDLMKRSSYYAEKYGFLPLFKAGIHSGLVTAGEIGLIKKDIVYTGDVLNTAARIQSLCNDHNVSILLSETIMELLDVNGEFEAISKGECDIRGRNENILLFTVLKL